MSDRPIILLTNDDGVHAKGITALRQAVHALGQIVVVAPTREQSASSHSITIDRPLRHVEHESHVHSIDGTPADCVYLALFEPRFLTHRPALVLSGINHGPNLGTSVFYSGTVAGAREAAMRGIPAMAFSCPTDADYTLVAAQAAQLAAAFLNAPKPAGRAALLNVNFPKSAARGLRVTRVGTQIYEEHVIPRRDPAGREYFWIGGRLVDAGEQSGTDTLAVAEGYIAVTPLQLEATDHVSMSFAADVVNTVAGSSGEIAPGLPGKPS